MLHLLEVGLHWPPEAFLCRKLEGLAARGVRVTVAANSLRDPAATLNGVELVPPGTRPAWRDALLLLIRSPRRLLRLLRGIRRVPPRLAARHGGRRGLLRMCLPLARLRPDVVQFEWNAAAVDHLPLFEVWGCPIVASCRDSDLTAYRHLPGRDRYAERLEEVLGRASAVHCVSESLRRAAVELGVDRDRTTVITPAVDAHLFRPGNRNGHSGFHVMMISELRWEKGYEYALQATRDLVDRGVPVRLELVGDGPQRDRIVHTIADLGLGKHVRLSGALAHADVSRRLAAADALLQTSLAEGIPNAVLEAMACGLPVVTTDVGAVEEVVTDGVEGFVVAPRDPAGLSAALLRLWREPELREEMGAAGRARILAGFTLERQLDGFLELYGEVTSRA
jgi:colanic acid/amylovoran biosynthesis glycosyltransferase